MSFEVCQPVAAGALSFFPAGSRRPGDDDPPPEIGEPDFRPARAPRFRAGGDDVDRPVGFQRLPDFSFKETLLPPLSVWKNPVEVNKTQAERIFIFP